MIFPISGDQRAAARAAFAGSSETRRSRRFFIPLAALTAVFAATTVIAETINHKKQPAQQFIQQELRIPVVGAGPKGLQALLVYPATPGKHPLVVLSHGSPRDGALRPQMTPSQMYPQAVEFARRGWVAAIIMRRGYGSSGGDWAEDYRSCSHAQYRAAGEAARSDLRTAIDYLSDHPQVDGSRILAVGVSAGGFATIALTAAPPPGLVAAINFAGGRGSTSPDTVCDERSLIEAFRVFGTTARKPMLWVYAENDHFFGPALAQRLLTAFKGGGGEVQFVQTGPFGEDGHALFSQKGVPVWAPIVDAFLQSQKLKLLDAPLPTSAPPNLPAPRPLSGDGLAAWKAYLIAPSHKAFAVSPSGRYGWRTGRASTNEAQAAALASCASAECAIVAIDDEWVSR